MPNSNQAGDQLDPQLFINLIKILETYVADDSGTQKPYLVKDGIKIIL